MHAEVSQELRQRGVIRSSNNPIGDLAEHLFCRVLRLEAGAKLKARRRRHGCRRSAILDQRTAFDAAQQLGSSGRCAICRPKALMCSLRFYFRRIVEFSGLR
jgi:hypothetical protein